jgi:signal transduction histidine kinase
MPRRRSTKPDQPGSDRRWQAWQTLRDEVAKTGLPVPDLLCQAVLSPAPTEAGSCSAQASSAPDDPEERSLAKALLLQEADWFLHELDLSLREVPHFVALLDREGRLLQQYGDPTPSAATTFLGETVLSSGRPAVVLSPPRSGSGAPGWTVIAFPLRPATLDIAGLLLTAYCDRRISYRVYAQAYSAAAAIERQLLWSDRLAQADRLSLVGTMISQIVHEVKNPLAAMKAALYLAKHSEGGEQAECLQLVDKEIEELNTLVENLLSLAKPASAQFALECLTPLLQEVVGLVRYEAALRNVRIAFRPGRSASFVRCDRRLLKQALLNLARNAIQAMPQGGVLTLAIRRKARLGGVEVEVADTGVGIAPENLAHLFQPFFTTKGKSGTGLGLSVTRRIVEKVHRGRISIASTVGVGTRFTLFLPFDPDASAVEAPGGNPV